MGYDKCHMLILCISIFLLTNKVHGTGGTQNIHRYQSNLPESLAADQH